MLYRALCLRNTYFGRRAGLHTHIIPFASDSSRWVSIQPHRSYTNRSQQPQAGPSQLRLRKVVNGPAYKTQSESIESIKPPPETPADESLRSIYESDAFLNLGRGNNPDDSLPNLDDFTKDQLSPDHIYGVRFFIQWKTYFRQIFHLEEKERAVAYERFACERAESFKLIGDKQVEEIQQQWLQLPRAEQMELLPRLLAGCVITSADQTLRLLQALPKLYRDFEIRMDCLLFIKRVHIAELTADPVLKDLFTFLVRNQLKNWHRNLYQMQTRHLSILLEHCPTNEIYSLLHRTIPIDAVPNHHTTFALIDYFTRHKDYEGALSSLKLLPKELIIASEPEILQRCTNLLKLDFVERQGSSQNFRLLPELLQLGIRPDVILHTVVIQNACKSGMPGVAWDLFRYMKTEMLEINSVTYLVLLKDAFMRKDVRSLNEILTAIHRREDLARNPYLIGCTMNVVRLICMERGIWPDATFSHMLAVYDRAFDRGALVRLGMTDELVAREEGLELPQPDPASLATAIWGYVLAQWQFSRVFELWLCLETLISRADAATIEAAKHPFFYHGFILFYGRTERGLPKALHIIQHMLEHDLCQPDARTWTFAIGVFLSNSQFEMAEKIRDMMKERNIFPNAQHWDRILNRWPESDIAAQARTTLEWETRRLEPPLQRDDGDELFMDLPDSNEGVRLPKSEVVFKGWNDMVDLRQPLKSVQPDPSGIFL